MIGDFYSPLVSLNKAWPYSTLSRPGGNSFIFFLFHPETLGKYDSQFDWAHILKKNGVGSTTTFPFLEWDVLMPEILIKWVRYTRMSRDGS